MDKSLFEQKRKSHIEKGEIYFWTATINQWQRLLCLGVCLQSNSEGHDAATRTIPRKINMSVKTHPGIS